MAEPKSSKLELQVGKLLLLALIGITATMWSVVSGDLASPLRAQSAGGQASSSRSPTAQWQADAGGKMAFDVASVKINKSSDDVRSYSNVTMDPGNEDPPNGGLFSATNFLLNVYVAFAYKIAPNQIQSLLSQMPKWATAEKFDIQARAEGNPTKDQMRQMMQSLLAERFKFVAHNETRQLPVFAVVLAKPGKTGPGLRPHLDDPPCAEPARPSAPESAPAAPAKASSDFPAVCDAFIGQFVTGRWRVSARNMSIERIASIFSVVGMFDRPMLDHSGLNGNFDFSLEFTPEFKGPANFQPDPTGPTFVEALQEQLGLKLESIIGPVDVLVIDHVEEPSAN
jgi:uncharacterized protein (TIGR03435 family)